MKIAVLGGGAMGALYGGYLSRKNDVTIVDVNTALIEKVKADGLKIAEPDGSSAVYHPAITSDTKGMQPVDLVIVFVKAMYAERGGAGGEPRPDRPRYLSDDAAKRQRPRGCAQALCG